MLTQRSTVCLSDFSHTVMCSLSSRSYKLLTDWTEDAIIQLCTQQSGLPHAYMVYRIYIKSVKSGEAPAVRLQRWSSGPDCTCCGLGVFSSSWTHPQSLEVCRVQFEPTHTHSDVYLQCVFWSECSILIGQWEAALLVYTNSRSHWSATWDGQNGPTQETLCNHRHKRCFHRKRRRRSAKFQQSWPGSAAWVQPCPQVRTPCPQVRTHARTHAELEALTSSHLTM